MSMDATKALLLTEAVLAVVGIGAALCLYFRLHASRIGETCLKRSVEWYQAHSREVPLAWPAEPDYADGEGI